MVSHAPAAASATGFYGWGVQLYLPSGASYPYDDAMDTLYYEDEEGGQQGPFPAAQMFQWHVDGHMPLQLPLMYVARRRTVAIHGFAVHVLCLCSTLWLDAASVLARRPL
jgi:hypothetical protein